VQSSAVVIWALLIVFVIAGLWLAAWFRRREIEQIRRGDWSSSSTLEISYALSRSYERGLVEPESLARAASLSRPWFFVGSALNTFVCLDVATGRYREALEWRTRWAWKKRRLGFEDEVIRVNEAEALACLGRLEESLAWAPQDASRSGFQMLIAGLAAHRAWVLAELGRIDDARKEVAQWGPWSPALGPYESEWHLSRFAVEFAAHAWDAASEALDAAERIAQRESSKRNVHFFRGRLAFAKGELEQALKHFERGAASPYRWQGGPALLDWGDALQKLGRVEEAREVWKRCVERDPQSPAAALAQKR
jgi:tetratricopeptide (TPR) repeat protein